MSTTIGDARPTHAPAAADEFGGSTPYTVKDGDSVYSIVKNYYEQSGPGLAFPERLSVAQARGIIGAVLKHNQWLTNDPHLLWPGQVMQIPDEVEIARRLIAGAPDDAAEEALLNQVIGSALEMAVALFEFLDEPFTPEQETEDRARAREVLTKPADFPSYGGPINPGVHLPPPGPKSK